ncbi:uncharacterized protein At1g27050 [Typha latifolia]|uniref:uncharacterized protein At1g27050 n=1 Tax=Typha latifolia TaxID=4733 RepID=UPI003C2FC70D
MRRGKRERSNPPPALSKRLRGPLPEPEDGELIASGERQSSSASPSPSLVMVTGLPGDCTVLELKYRLEMYGPISRIRIDVDGSGYVTFRSAAAAESAIAASLDPALGIAIRSQKVLVVQSSDPLLHWKRAVRVSPTSKLLRGETPLRKHGRSNKKLNAEATTPTTRSGYKGREIVAYDDLF